MTLAELTPDVALAAMLDGKVEVQTSATKRYAIRCYEQGKQPNKGLGDEFLTVQTNGVISSWTRPRGQYSGNLALWINSKANADNTAKVRRMMQIAGECEGHVDRRSAEGFYFELDATNVITPPTVDLQTGYAAMILNVAWHTTK